MENQLELAFENTCPDLYQVLRGKKGIYIPIYQFLISLNKWKIKPILILYTLDDLSSLIKEYGQNCYCRQIHRDIHRIVWSNYLLDFFLVKDLTEYFNTVDYTCEMVLLSAEDGTIINKEKLKQVDDAAKQWALIKKTDGKTCLKSLIKAYRMHIAYDMLLPKTIEDDQKEMITKKRFSPYPPLGRELIFILSLEKPSVVFDRLHDAGLLSFFLPELAEGLDIKQNEFHRYDVYKHCVYTADAALQTNILVRTAALFHDIGKSRSRKELVEEEQSKFVFYNHELISASIAKRILKKYGFSQALIADVIKLVRMHMFHYTKNWTDNAVRRFMRNIGEELFEDLFLLRDADRLGSGKKKSFSRIIEQLKNHVQAIKEEDAKLTVKDLAVDGNDLIQDFGLRPSPLFGDLLRHLLGIVEEDVSKNTKETLYKEIEDYLKVKGINK